MLYLETEILVILDENCAYNLHLSEIRRKGG